MAAFISHVMLIKTQVYNSDHELLTTSNHIQYVIKFIQALLLLTGLARETNHARGTGSLLSINFVYLPILIFD